jgi:hypothetical protein
MKLNRRVAPDRRSGHDSRIMKVRLEVKLSGLDREQDLIRDLEMPAPPSAGLHVVGRGWRVEIERVSFMAESAEYRARCVAVRDDTKSIADLIRPLEIEDWRAVLPK